MLIKNANIPFLLLNLPNSVNKKSSSPLLLPSKLPDTPSGIRNGNNLMSTTTTLIVCNFKPKRFYYFRFHPLQLQIIQGRLVSSLQDLLPSLIFQSLKLFPFCSFHLFIYAILRRINFILVHSNPIVSSCGGTIRFPRWNEMRWVMMAMTCGNFDAYLLKLRGCWRVMSSWQCTPFLYCSYLWAVSQ